MKKQLLAIFATLLCVSAFATTNQQALDDQAALQAAVDAAVANSTRPEKDTLRDVDRKPAQVMKFSGIKPGDVVADVGSAGGYYTRILSGIVGPEGRVHGFNGKEFARVFKNGNPTDPIAEELENVSSIMGTFNAPVFPEPLDSAIIVLIYHDTHLSFLGIDTAVMNKALFAALKPGGTYIVIDHAAETGSGARDTDKLHRIDPVMVKQEVEAAGFEFVEKSDILSHPEDAHNTMVMLPTERGKSDRFIFKFRKPG
jgi:predicted methyltransferase